MFTSDGATCPSAFIGGDALFSQDAFDAGRLVRCFLPQWVNRSTTSERMSSWLWPCRREPSWVCARVDSLADAEPELAGFARGPELATRRIVPDTGGPPEEVLQGPPSHFASCESRTFSGGPESPEQEAERPLAPVPSAPSAPSAPSVPSPPAAPYAPAAPATAPGVSFASSRSDAISDPEWAPRRPEEAAGATARARPHGTRNHVRVLLPVSRPKTCSSWRRWCRDPWTWQKPGTSRRRSNAWRSWHGITPSSPALGKCWPPRRLWRCANSSTTADAATKFG
eukprot:g31512.t1